MIAADLEKIVPGLAEERAKERINRALAFAGITHTVCGLEIMSLTPAHRLGLQLVGSAFVRGAEPTYADSAQFLWYLSRDYAPPEPCLAGEEPEELKAIDAKNARLTRRRESIARHLATLNEHTAGLEIKVYLSSQLQDIPASAFDAESVDYSNWVHWVAMDVSFWLNVHGGFTIETYLRTPYLVLQQLYRAWQCNHPKTTRNPDGTYATEEPTFINRSDQLIGNWHAKQREEIAEFMRKPRDRLN